MNRVPVRFAIALLFVAGTVLAVRLIDVDHTQHVSSGPATGPTACRAPAEAAPTPAPPTRLAPPASVTVPGAASIDTSGLLPGPVAEAGDGSTWVIVGTPNAAAVGGRVARVDVEHGAFTTVTSVVDGCDASALAAGQDSIWVGTCDARAAVGSTSGAELVSIDTSSGRVRNRVELPGTCVASVAVVGDDVWASSAASTASPQRLWRVNASSGAVDEPVALGDGETITGFAVTSEAVWTSRHTTAGDRVIRSDARTGAQSASLTSSPGRVVGALGDTLWTQDDSDGALVARDGTSGKISATVAAANVRSIVVGPNAVWLEQAARGSLTITLSKIEAGASALTSVVSFTGPGPDRTGLPFLGLLSATPRGLWFASQDRLFLIAGAAPVAPTTTSTPSTTLSPTSTSTSTTSTPATGG